MTAAAEEPTRRDILYIATGAVGVVGLGFAVTPFIAQMNPDASALALASIEVDISTIEPGQQVRLMWRGKPVFIRNRTEAEIEEAKKVEIGELPDPYAQNENLAADDPATDENRAIKGRENLILMIGVCTHLGCIPLSEAGEYGGWFCPCHGSHYDTAGRIRKGPAPRNLDVPTYEFLDENTLKIG